MKRVTTWLALLFALAILSSVRVLAQATVQYFYDELDRLVGVVDLNGDSATYTYDAVGNILAINRYASTQVSIVTFSPKAGPIGSVVTIFGTGFSATPAENTVTFNGTGAAVSSASTTQLVVTVPAGATTGAIAVTAPGGSATSGSPFTITTGGSPTITSFTPTIGVGGTSVSLTGTNFNTTPALNYVLFNDLGGTAVSSASPTSLTTSVPPVAASGHVTVATPAGTATSSADFFVPPSPYVASDVVSTGRVSLGSSIGVPVATATRIGLVVFDATLGHRVSLKIVPGPISTVRIFKPNSTMLATLDTGVTTTLIEPQAMGATGTYLISVDPAGTATGTTTVTPYDVPADLTGTIGPGGSTVNAVLSVPGQNAVYALGTPTNARVSLKVSGPTGTAYVLNADGTTLKSGAISGVVSLVEPWTFTAGQSIKADPLLANTGTVALTAYDVPNDSTGSLTINDSAVPVTITAPGQNGTRTFTGSASQQATVRVTGNTVPGVTVKLLSIDGTTVLASSSSILSSFNLSTVTLPSAGTYTVSVDPTGVNTGTLNVAVTSP